MHGCATIVDLQIYIASCCQNLDPVRDSANTCIRIAARGTRQLARQWEWNVPWPAVLSGATCGAPDARISHGEIVKSETGENLLRLTVENIGQRRAILQRPVVTLQTGGQTIELSDEAAEALNNRNIIAGTQAVIDLPVADSLSPGPVSASLKTDYFRN